MRVLLVDHDSEGLETIARAIRGVLEIDCVTSKGDALLLLRQNTYDVLIACERAVDGSGLDLLGRTTRTAVPLKRIFAAYQRGAFTQWWLPQHLPAGGIWLEL